MKNIKREKYLKRIRSYYNKQLIKAITGQRRVGKSFLLHQVKDELIAGNPSGNVIFIDKEIDFIAKKKGEYIYIQVAYLLTGEKVVKREFGNLINIPDNYPKYVITMDEFPASTSYKGIKQLHLMDFLSSEI